MSFKPSLLHFKFGEFADFRYKNGYRCLSENVKDAQGRSWRLLLYPGGESPLKNPDSDPKVSVFLCNMENTDVCVSATFIIENGEGEEITKQLEQYLYKGRVNGGRSATRGGKDWIPRSRIIEYLDSEGALLINVLVQVQPPLTYVLPDPFVSRMLALYDGGIGCDVTFKVGDHLDLIHAHKLIIQAHSQVLCNCIKNKDAPVLITGVSRDAFAEFLRCFYGGSVSDSLSVAVRRDIIEAADRFEVPHIKIAAETSLARESIMSDDNVCDWYEFSHYKTCPLLKEQAGSYFILRGPALLRSARSEQLKESPQLLVELMKEMFNHDNKTRDTMGVNELRKELAEQGLNVDGSKEILMSRLQSSKKRQREE